MRKIWSRIFVLCMACMICMCGLCLAADDGNWIKFHHQSNFTYYVNPTSIKVHEWGGRKFLEVKAYNDQRFGSAPEENFREEDLIAIDVENRKYVNLEVGLWDGNQKGGITSVNDISKIVNGKELLSWYDKLIKWVEKNRPDLIKEIREHNKTAPSLESLRNTPPERTDAQGATHGTLSDSTPQPTPGTQAQPGGNVDVTGATGDMTPSGFNITEDGWVGFTCRSMRPLFFSDRKNDIPQQFIFARPASFNEIGFFPEYIIAFVCPEDGFYWMGTRYTDTAGKWGIGETIGFDYDPRSNTFTFYDNGRTDSNKVDPTYFCRIRVIDKNTVFCESLDSRHMSEGQPNVFYVGTFSYVPVPANKTSDGYSDGYWWYGKYQERDGRTFFAHEYISLQVDAALAFLATHGNVTEPPEDFLENSVWADLFGL